MIKVPTTPGSDIYYVNPLNVYRITVTDKGHGLVDLNIYYIVGANDNFTIEKTKVDTLITAMSEYLKPPGASKTR